MLLGEPDFPAVVKQRKRFPRRRSINHGTGMCERGLGVKIFFPSERTMIHNGTPRNPPCLRLHLIDRRKDRPEKLPAPFYYPPRGPIKSWTRIPKDLVLKEPPTRYFSRETFVNSRASDPRRLNLCQNFFQFPILAADTMKTALFSSSFLLRHLPLSTAFDISKNMVDCCASNSPCGTRETL